MRRTLSRRMFLSLGIGGSLVAGSSGCGTIWFPERAGQPRGGPLDWRVVAMDTAALMLFIVPGVIAFAVDFYNGAIYLPVAEYGAAGPRREELATVVVTDQELSKANVEQIVSRHAGKPVQLAAGNFRQRSLTRLQQFWTVHDELAAS